MCEVIIVKVKKKKKEWRDVLLLKFQASCGVVGGLLLGRGKGWFLVGFVEEQACCSWLQFINIWQVLF